MSFAISRKRKTHQEIDNSLFYMSRDFPAKKYFEGQLVCYFTKLW